MRLLAHASAIDGEVVKLLHAGARITGAVAWASTNFPAVDHLLAHLDQIDRLVVGLHFYQTSPEFIRRTLASPHVRFIRSTSGVFHPKCFLFSASDGSWECIVGSANLTVGGFASNDEVAVLFDQNDVNGREVRDGLLHVVDDYWLRSEPMTPALLDSYEAMWRSKAQVLRRLAASYGAARTRNRKDDGGASPLQAPILRTTWADFLKQVTQDSLFGARLETLSAVKAWFQEYAHFGNMPDEIRRRIAGIISEPGGPDWLLFGSMRGAGTFMNVVQQNNSHLAAAVDAIPLDGVVSLDSYLEFVEHFKRAFQGRRGSGDQAIATATRLLAMKRPDTFVCVDSKNRTALSKAFSISSQIGLPDYWSSVCERIFDSAWWNVPRPDSPVERNVWEGRAALLDSLYYVPPEEVTDRHGIPPSPSL